MADATPSHEAHVGQYGLDDCERWMFEVITHPGGVEAGLDEPESRRYIPVDRDALEKIVAPSQALSSLERLEIYSNMYRWRLVDVLVDEYPTVRRVVGQKRFYDLAVEYITQYPPHHYDLGKLGQRFPSFLAEASEPLPHRRFAGELARLERSMEEIFDAAHADPIDVDDFLRIPTEAWGGVRLRTIPALALHEFQHPVNRYLQAVREDRHLDLPAPETNWVAVYRSDETVWRVALSREQFHLLKALEAGMTLATAIQTCAELPNVDLGRLTEKLREWFQEWAGDGLFRAIE